MPKHKPPPIQLGTVRARVVRGPRASDNRFYWRTERKSVPSDEDLGCRWATGEEAATWVAQLVLDQQAGPGGVQRERIETVLDLMECWLGQQEQRSDLRPSSQYIYRYSALHLVNPERGLRSLRLDQINRAALDGYVRAARAHGQAANTIMGDLRILGIAWGWGRDEGHCKGRLSRPKLPAEPRRRTRTPTPAEVDQVIAVASGWVRLALLLLRATGMRRGELAHLRWEDYRPAEGLLHIRVSKTGARIVPVARSVIAELAQRPRLSEWLLGVKPRTVEMLSAWLPEACKKLGIEPFTPHGLRRLAVDLLYEGGKDVGLAAELLGHSPEIALAKYRRPRQSHLLSAVELLAGAR